MSAICCWFAITMAAVAAAPNDPATVGAAAVQPAAIDATPLAAAPIDFDTEIVPILTKAGCNTGACHGAAVGRGGFKLSLYGGNASVDYESIVEEFEGRRINLYHPDESLVVLKPTGMLDHGGDVRLDYDGADAARLTAWIAQGAPRLGLRRLDELTLAPTRQVLEEVGVEVPLAAMARFDDGSEVDVTPWTVFTAADPSAVAIDETTAVATVLRRGQNIVVARYLDRVVPIELIVPLSDEPVDLAHQPRVNFIDEYVLDMLEVLRVPVSPPADDATFLRRIHLDLTGRLTSPEEVDNFLADADPDKRAEVVDQLLASPAFVEYWTYEFAKLLRIRAAPQQEPAALAFHNWLKDQIAEGTAYDEMARTMLLAVGDSFEYGPANFYRVAGDARGQAEYVGQVLMGVRLQCANCHNHPLDRWTQDDYHGLAAIFARVEPGRVVKVSERGEVTHPRTGEPAVPRIPGERFLDQDVDGREALAAWLLQADNPYFARAIVNRLWKSMMGRGLIEPTDDLRATNAATHPALLAALADDFASHGYDLRHTLRAIAASATYARSATALEFNRADDRFYSHALVRPLEPEVLADALADVADVWDQYGDQPPATRAVSLYDPGIESDALDILGRCSRQDSCEAAPSTGGGLTTKLHMINGRLINQKLAAPEGRLAKLIAAGVAERAIVAEFYVRALGRNPSPEERSYWDGQLTAADDPDERAALLEDIAWSLLTCREFATNH